MNTKMAECLPFDGISFGDLQNTAFSEAPLHYCRPTAALPYGLRHLARPDPAVANELAGLPSATGGTDSSRLRAPVERLEAAKTPSNPLVFSACFSTITTLCGTVIAQHHG
jgi:hypothetical protein